MANALWTDTSILQHPEPRRSAPPVMQQSTQQAQDDVIWDDSMMDLEDYEENGELPIQRSETAPEAAGQGLQHIDIDPSNVRPEAVHLRGVDNMSTDDVKLYVSSLYPSYEYKIEWIDDTSLNLAFESADIATTALQILSSAHIEELPPSTIRPAKALAGEKPVEGLKVRIAFMGDKKERGARDRSRWYLFNPHPSEDRERERRRDYDTRRRRYEPYSRRRRSRSRTPPLNYDDTGSNQGIELFPSKLNNGTHCERSHNGPQSRSPEYRRRRIEGSHPVFSNIIHSVSPTDQKNWPARSEESSFDLFPAKAAELRRAAGESILEPPSRHPSQNALSVPSIQLESHTSDEEMPSQNEANKSVELFPDKLRKPINDRITKTLAERIQDDGSMSAKELFPDLVYRDGGTRRRRRRKAEDHF